MGANASNTVTRQVATTTATSTANQLSKISSNNNQQQVVNQSIETIFDGKFTCEGTLHITNTANITVNGLSALTSSQTADLTAKTIADYKVQ